MTVTNLAELYNKNENIVRYNTKYKNKKNKERKQNNTQCTRRKRKKTLKQKHKTVVQNEFKSIQYEYSTRKEGEEKRSPQQQYTQI